MYFRLWLVWHAIPDVYDLVVDEEMIPFDTSPRQRRTPQLHSMTRALQLLDPTVCARQIMDKFDTVKTIVLQWDHGSRPLMFAAITEDEGGVRMLRNLDVKAAKDLIFQTEKSWDADLPRYDFFM